MTLKEHFSRFMTLLRQGPYGDSEGYMKANMPNGGHTGWHPIPEKKQRTRTGMTQQNTPVHTGYTQNQMQTGYQAGNAPQQTGYQAGAFQQTGYQASASSQTGYQAGAFQQTGYQAGAFQQTGYQAGAFQQTGYQAGAFQQTGAFANGYGAGRATRTPEAAQNAQGADNLRYFPGTFVSEDGSAFRMVERLAQPVSAASCYRLIEFMRNGESIIVNTELIRDEYEVTRCLDLLYGAAFTMGYTFTRIASRSIYLISPASVMVMPYESLRQLNEQDAAQRWPGSTKESVGLENEGRPLRRGGDFHPRRNESAFGRSEQRFSV